MLVNLTYRQAAALALSARMNAGTLRRHLEGGHDDLIAEELRYVEQAEQVIESAIKAEHEAENMLRALAGDR